ncbi:MAG: hypothetical protein FJY85_17110, partial [Deltaproteobacteria bacterium]|nr:hypothetical protein [Deltaproteobacteria bacterium]
FEAIYHQTLPLREARKTATRLVVELEELLVHSSPAAGSSDGLGYDRASIPSYRSAIFEVTELGLATGGGDEFLALARIGSADFPPGTCKGRLDPAYLLVQCRLEWIASRNNWQQVLRIGHCLANSVENRPVLALDMVNRWTAALCIPPEGGKIGD